ncbi:MAG: hypothetical protein C0478_15345 [Planctomyces sp.]|nr:hypothetical protein [Planctomyces sp.]
MAESLRGKLLVATKQLKDPTFYKTVVLIVEDNEHGSMGLVLNRPSSILVNHALSEHFQLPESHELVHVGGPVEPAALFILHNIDELSHEKTTVIPGVWLGNSGEAFEDVLKTTDPDDPAVRFRVFCGCAGWSPGQLEGELAHGDWLVAPANRTTVFAEDPYEIYDNMLQEVFAAHRILPHTSPNPQWN